MYELYGDKNIPGIGYSSCSHYEEKMEKDETKDEKLVIYQLPFAQWVPVVSMNHEVCNGK